ncbi:hypothetical protein [Sinimarinibacterium sp. NLF-5-8]|uniref:hypothetical protein n=1 Tax=Sinimarinibacterium sp. NLF-5-8 TaxID=2698684 RepID=UPI00137BB76F|nr:hypothetical protein [Sinimarinibacterium sp. NLF-5-8]QHS09077.1 hypothetical protein GT972_02215 [Sinimarinibacterium sp. NLF-5-8]
MNIKNGVQSVLCAIAMLTSIGSSAHADEPLLGFEVVDLTCNYCADFAAPVDRIAARVREKGGAFRVIPVGPLVGNSATPVLSVMVIQWMLLNRSDAEVQKAVAAFYAGYQGGANLNSLNAIASWLQLHDIHVPTDLDLSAPELTEQFAKSVRLVNKAQIRKLPAIVFIDPLTGDIQMSVSRGTDLADMEQRVLQFVSEKSSQ